MRRWRYTSFTTSSTTSFGYFSARMRSSVMRAPTTSWWWKLTPPSANERVLGLPTSWNSAARRTRSSGRVLRTTAIVCASTSLWVWIGSCSSRMRLSSGRNSSARSVSARNQSPVLGSSTSRSFDSSSRMRSALTISSRWRSSTTAAVSAGVGGQLELRDEARRAQHAQRIVEERHLGRQRCAQATRREVDRAAERVDEHRFGEAQRHRVHGEVAPREIGLDVVGEHDLRLAALGSVHLGAERRDLEHGVVLATADGAEALALQPDRVGPRPHDPLDDVGTGVGREVDVDVFPVAERPVEERVAHAAADEVALVPGVGEQARQLLRDEPGRAAGAGGAGSRTSPPFSSARGPHRAETMRDASRPPQASLRYRRRVDGLPTCSRLGCGEPAVAVFAFDASECLVWLDPIGTPGRGAGVLCDTHADRMSPPRGWNLLDRRASESRLWIGRVPTTSAGPHPAHRRRERAARRERARRPRPRLPFDATDEPGRRSRPDRSATMPAVYPSPSPAVVVTARSSGSGVRSGARRPHPVAGARLRGRAPVDD